MAEYISRNAAIEEIDEWLDTVGTVLVGKGLSYYGELIGCIEDTPAADVAPAVHGEWMFGEIGPVGCTVKCSACGWGLNNVDPVLWTAYSGHKYCGNCGAKMDEVSE